MTDSRFHGVSTREFVDVPRAVELIDTSRVGLIGTAPDADDTNWPLNTPVLINGARNLPQGLTDGGTLKDSLEAIWSQANATVIAVRVAEGDDGSGNEDVAATMANMLGDRAAMTGIHALRRAPIDLGVRPRILVAPGYTSQRPTDGVASVTVDSGGTGYEVAPTVTASGDGTGFRARAVVSGGSVTEVIVENPGSGYTTPPTLTITAAEGDPGSGATATAALGTVANPVAKELESVASAIRAVTVIDGPNTSYADALQSRRDFGSDRVYIVDPWVKVMDGGGAIVSQPPSAFVAGVMVRVDRERGFWHSPSNKEIRGILGTSRPISWGLSDPDSEAEALNDQDIATIIRNTNAGGFYLWGNRTTSSDPATAFLPTRRSSDVIVESIEMAAQVYVDQPFSVELLVNIAETASAGLRKLRAKGATIGSRVWLDRSLNTPESFQKGKLFISYDAEPPAPAEHIVFHYHRNTGYYEELAEEAAREIARLNS